MKRPPFSRNATTQCSACHWTSSASKTASGFGRSSESNSRSITRMIPHTCLSRPIRLFIRCCACGDAIPGAIIMRPCGLSCFCSRSPGKRNRAERCKAQKCVARKICLLLERQVRREQVVRPDHGSRASKCQLSSSPRNTVSPSREYAGCCGYVRFQGDLPLR